MIDLTTSYLGLALKNPLVVSPSPLCQDVDRIRAMAPDHPEWKDTEPYKSILAGDLEGLARQGEHSLLEVVMQTHAGMSVDDFKAIE